MAHSDRESIDTSELQEDLADQFGREISAGQRFEFGKNWRSFLKLLTDERIEFAIGYLQRLLQLERLDGLRFLDIGSGSGLSSLAARRLGASVHSFDFDPSSVGCTQELKRRYFDGDPNWTIQQGSVLDREYLESLGRFDVVYSWGVLHHTGQMWRAIEHAADRVAPGGRLFIAIYNDQVWKSRMWLRVKQIYCSGWLGRWLMLAMWVPYFFVRTCVASLIRWENKFSRDRQVRGMNALHDWIDWIGGLPFEVASADEVIHFHKQRGFQLLALVATKGLGNSEFVFVKR